jgi:hypothetical protein
MRQVETALRAGSDLIMMAEDNIVCEATLRRGPPLELPFHAVPSWMQGSCPELYPAHASAVEAAFQVCQLDWEALVRGFRRGDSVVRQSQTVKTDDFAVHFGPGPRRER